VPVPLGGRNHTDGGRQFALVDSFHRKLARRHPTAVRFLLLLRLLNPESFSFGESGERVQTFSIGPGGIEQIRQKAADCFGSWRKFVSSLRQRARTAPRTLLHAQASGRSWTGDRTAVERAVEEPRRTQSALTLSSAASAATDERRRVAAQIHHGLAQHVANVVMQLQLCQRYLAADPARGKELLHNAIRFSQMAMDATRATIYELQYPSKQHPRIAALLHATAERLRSLTTAEIDIDVEGVGPLSPEMESGLCAIACEALTNAVKHSAAEHVSVRLRRNQDNVVLEISDDGIGFDPDTVRASDWGELGLKLMTEQAQRLGGTFQMERRASGGTLAKAVVRSALRSSTPRGPDAVTRPDGASGE